jgi:hypothetical protein
LAQSGIVVDFEWVEPPKISKFEYHQITSETSRKLLRWCRGRIIDHLFKINGASTALSDYPEGVVVWESASEWYDSYVDGTLPRHPRAPQRTYVYPPIGFPILVRFFSGKQFRSPRSAVKSGYVQLGYRQVVVTLKQLLSPLVGDLFPPVTFKTWKGFTMDEWDTINRDFKLFEEARLRSDEVVWAPPPRPGETLSLTAFVARSQVSSLTRTQKRSARRKRNTERKEMVLEVERAILGGETPSKALTLMYGPTAPDESITTVVDDLIIPVIDKLTPVIEELEARSSQGSEMSNATVRSSRTLVYEDTVSETVAIPVVWHPGFLDGVMPHVLGPNEVFFEFYSYLSDVKEYVSFFSRDELDIIWLKLFSMWDAWLESAKSERLVMTQIQVVVNSMLASSGIDLGPAKKPLCETTCVHILYRACTQANAVSSDPHFSASYLQFADVNVASRDGVAQGKGRRLINITKRRLRC